MRPQILSMGTSAFRLQDLGQAVAACSAVLTWQVSEKWQERATIISPAFCRRALIVAQGKERNGLGYIGKVSWRLSRPP